MNRGVIFSAYGNEAINECLHSIRSLKRSNPDLPVCVLTDDTKAFRSCAGHVCRVDSDPFGRRAKLSVDLFSPFDFTLYLDADTRVHLPIDLPFLALEQGFEFVGTFSANQGDMWMIHLKQALRESAEDFIGYQNAQAQGGVFAFRKCPSVKAFFNCWRGFFAEGDGEHDQDAMQKALHVQPMRAYYLGRDWNGGTIVHHHYSMARRKDIK